MLIDFSDGRMNGLECMILQSEEYADYIIRLFKRDYEPGDDPDSLLQTICMALDISDGDLLSDSKKRVENEIRNYLMRY